MFFGTSKIIAFSGGCYSGKTTTLEAVRAALVEKGYRVCVLGELIRKVTDKPIDELRKNPTEYFEIQKKIISEKINQERHAFKAIDDDRFDNAHNDTVFLADRAISDSIFYYENYVDKSSLPDDQIKEYCEFHCMLLDYAREAFNNYTVVVEFKPLNDNSEEDSFRPKNISHLKTYEYESIQRINAYYNAQSYSMQLMHCDLNNQTTDNVVSEILRVIGL